jgi:UDPglucose--hexose-1-phosphate uridylyltransferase
MPYNELRKDYLLNRWAVIATERSKRPTDFAKPKPQVASNTVCPMCVGNEQMTPPAVMLYVKEKGKLKVTSDPSAGARTQNWLVRCIPNLYPAFNPPKQPQDATQIFLNETLANAIGHHEVIIESPNHDEGPANATLNQLELVIKAYLDRLKYLSSKPYVKYVSIFRNYGIEAGASLSHAHSQIIATPIVPPLIQEELDASKNFQIKAGRCIFCDIIKRETESPRLILENKEFTVIAPYASIHPMEFWIIPKTHAANPLKLTPTQKTCLVQTLKTSLQALKAVVNDPPYNYGFHLSLNPLDAESYHWHLEVYPKLSTWAGFEKNTGIYINTVTPEATAESLRNAIKMM